MPGNAERRSRTSQQVPMPRRPLGRTLALLFCSLFLVVIAIYSLAAYEGMRRVVLGSVEQRLAGGVDQFASLLQTSARQLVAGARGGANAPAVPAYLKEGGRSRQTEALAALRNTAPKPAPGLISVALLDSTGQRLLGAAINPPGTEGSVEPGEVQAASRSNSGRVGRFRASHDSVYYPAIAPVRDEGRILGYVVHWRRLTSNPQQRDAIVRLLGDGAGLYLRNDSGDAWNDMVKPVPKPPVELRLGAGLLSYERPGSGKLLGYARPVAGTSWVILLEVLAWVREQDGLKRLPVVVLTSSRETRDINRAYDLGANSYLVKPVGFENLFELAKSLNLYWLMLNEEPDLTRPSP